MAPALLAAAADDTVVAQRGADRITIGQARAIVAAQDPDTRRKLDTLQAVAGLLRTVLLQRAVLQQAQAQGWERRPDVAVLLQRTRDLTVSQSFLAAQAALPQGYPGEADIQAAYEQARPRLMQPRAYHIAQLFLAGTPADAAAARRSLSTVASHAAHGRSLAAIASGLHGATYGDLGWVPETQLAPIIKAGISGLQEGAITDPICLQNGCHLVQLVATRPAGPAPLPAVRDALVQALRQQKQAAGEQAYANDLLARQPVQLNEIELARITAP